MAAVPDAKLQKLIAYFDKANPPFCSSDEQPTLVAFTNWWNRAIISFPVYFIPPVYQTVVLMRVLLTNTAFSKNFSQPPGVQAMMALDLNGHIKFETPSKFQPKYIGPFKILDMHGHGNAARLDLPDSFKARRIHDVFNVGLLKLHVDCPAEMGPQRHNHPPPLADTPHGMFWEVNRVEKVAYRCGCKMVFVHWKGYCHESDSWEPYTKFAKDCPQALAEYKARQPPAASRKPLGRRVSD